MRIGIIGTGAVGGYFGGKLKLAGFDVVFLSKGKTLKVLQKEGLKIETRGKVLTIKNALFTNNAKKLGKLDYILFTVKSYDTKKAAQQIKAIVTKNTSIITPQNGINNDEILGKILGKEKIIPAMAQIGVNMSEPGYIKHTSMGILTMGEYNGKYSQRLKKIETALRKAEISCIVSNQIQVNRWKKFAWNSTFNIVAAITGLRLDQILNDKKLYKLCEDTIKEIEEIAIKEGINFGKENFVQARFNFAKLMGKYKPSTLEDLEKGKPTEFEAFTGAVLALGKKHKLPVETNKKLYKLLRQKMAKRH